MFLSTHENQHEAESIPVQKSSYFKTVLNPVIYLLSQQQFIIVYVQAWGFKKKKKTMNKVNGAQLFPYIGYGK